MHIYRYRSLIEGLYMPYRSLMEALYTLNSPPVVSFNFAQASEPWGTWDCCDSLAGLGLPPKPQALQLGTLGKDSGLGPWQWRFIGRS